jgi:putative oxidoreductase
MDKALASFAPYAYAILRLIAGLLFISHSGQKLFGWFGGDPVPVASLFGVAALMEMLLGLLITIGLLTSYAAFIASGERAVAYFIGHFPKSFWPLGKRGRTRGLTLFHFLVYGDSGLWNLEYRSSARERKRND